MKSEESSVNWSWRGGGGSSECWKGISFSNPAYNSTPNYHISVLAVTFSFNLYVWLWSSVNYSSRLDYMHQKSPSSLKTFCGLILPRTIWTEWAGSRKVEMWWASVMISFSECVSLAQWWKFSFFNCSRACSSFLYLRRNWVEWNSLVRSLRFS